jgi:hypothetical protein
MVFGGVAPGGEEAVEPIAHILRAQRSRRGSTLQGVRRAAPLTASEFALGASIPPDVSDSGWYRNAAPNSTNPIYNADFAIAVTRGGGKATTNPGLVSSEFRAGAFGQTAIPANQPGGANYATGDARRPMSASPAACRERRRQSPRSTTISRPTTASPTPPRSIDQLQRQRHLVRGGKFAERGADPLRHRPKCSNNLAGTEPTSRDVGHSITKSRV